MREIKFRGKISKLLRNGGRWIFWGINGTDMIDSVDPETIGQLTGLTDKNGVEIYDGDIVNAWDWGQPPNKLICVSKVYWDSDDKGWGLSPDPADGDRYDLFRNIEVIGNIYETPELIE